MKLYERTRARLVLARCAAVGVQPTVAGRLWVRGAGNVRVGNFVRFDARAAPIELFADLDAEIVIGDHVVIEGGTSIEARKAVRIGDRVQIARDCKILDNHLHTLRSADAAPESSPVVVGAGARLGRGAILLPGACVGADAVVPPGGVVRGRRTGRGSSGASAGRRAAAPGLAGRIWEKSRRAAKLVAGAIGGWVFVRGVRRRGRIYARGPVEIDNRGTIDVGDRVIFIRGIEPTRLACAEGASIAIGDSTQFCRATIEAHRSIQIGSNCMLAPGVRVCDRGPNGIAPIVIGNDVWLAHGVIVGPGVTIGAGSIVSAGSNVERDVPASSLAAGNPARSVSLSLAAGRSGSSADAPGG